MNCPDCGGQMRFITTGRYGPFYGCLDWPDCKGVISADEDGNPTAAPACSENRALRIQAHAAFDALWKSSNDTKRARAHAYHWLAGKMKMTQDECHIAQFDSEQCREVLRLIKVFCPNGTLPADTGRLVR